MMATAQGESDDPMGDRRHPEWYVPSISLGNLLTIMGGLGALVVFLITLGVWKGAIDTQISNQREMIRDVRIDVKGIGDKLDRVAESVASLDGKLTTIGPLKKAGLP